MNDLSEEENVLCIKFNGWLFEGYEDAKVALIGSILDEINKAKTPKGKAKKILKNLYGNTDFFKLSNKLTKYGIDFLLTGGILSITDITIETIKNALLSKGKQVEDKEIEGVFKAFKSKEITRSAFRQYKFFKLLIFLLLNLLMSCMIVSAGLSKILCKWLTTRLLYPISLYRFNLCPKITKN
ncbi:hypothetical protein EZS27_040112 [termite gut metagenome]|uniref:Uncharacterized protein n=1 Tax=termite gut metagenome TaxID=433724 RepID=A0A5J4PH59_9ZZZZ